MQKPTIPSAASGLQGRALRESELLRKKKGPGVDDAASAAQPADGVQVADAAAAASGAEAATGTAGASAAATGSAAGTAAAGLALDTVAVAGAPSSSWLLTGGLWLGAGAAVGLSRGGGSGGEAAVAPVGANAAFSGSENDAAITGRASGSDANGDALHYSLVGLKPAGLTFNADGSFSYVPTATDNALTAGQSRVVSFDYLVSDGYLSSAPATITLTINGANDAPAAPPLARSGSEDDLAITGRVQATDAEGDTVSYRLVAAVPGLTFNADGSFSYVPQPADRTTEPRVVTFQYIASDGSADSAPATVTITLNGANDAPVAAAAAVTGSEDLPALTGTVQASDADGQPLTYTVAGAAPAGLTLNADGSFSYVPQAADQALDAGETRQVTFQYVANDGLVSSVPATVTITVNGANDIPVLNGTASVSGSEDVSAITGNLPAATDIDGEALTYRVVGTLPTGLVFNADGSFTYFPQSADQALDDGEMRAVTFLTVADDGTGTSAPATVTVTVTGANDAPVATNTLLQGSENVSVITGKLIASDVDGETLTYSLTAAPPAGLVLNPDGTVNYVPQAVDQAMGDNENRLVTFDFVVTDGTATTSTATAVLVVHGANDAPVSGGALTLSGSEDDATFSGQVPAATDVDDATVTYQVVGEIPVGLTFNSNGTFSYALQAADQALGSGETRTLTFDYVASDGALNSAPATVTLIVTGVNDAPVSGGDQSVSASKSATVNASVTAATDVEGDPLTYALTAAAPAGLTFNADGSFSYVMQPVDQALAANEARSVVFSYTVSDGTATSAATTVTLTITGGHLPVAGGNVAVSGAEDAAAITGSVPAGSDADGDTLTYHVIGAAPAGLTFNTDGSFSYVPQAADQALDAGETRQVTFQYAARDFAVDSAPATVTITVSGANDAPVAAGKSLILSEDTVLNGSVVASDADDETLTYAVVGAPQGVNFHSDGTFTITPLDTDQGLDDGESRTFTFLYTASDGTVTSEPAAVTVTIVGANDAPQVGFNFAVGSEDDAVISGAVAGIDADGDALTYHVVGTPLAGLTFNADGTFTYVPQPTDQGAGENGFTTLSFIYAANDGTVDSAYDTVGIVLTGHNDAPVASNVTVSGSEDAILNGMAVASDPDGNLLQYNLVGTVPAGLSGHANGTFSYTPQAEDQALDDGESRQIVFQYTVSDGTATSAPATVTLIINGANDAPVSGGALQLSGSEDDAAISGSVPTATDVDGDTLSYALTAAAPAGLTFNTDGTFIYVPQAADQALNTGESRDITFDYIVHDGSADSLAATVTLTIQGVTDV